MAGCGGVLGARLSEGVEPLPDIVCTTEAASVDDQSYSAAVTEALNDFPFAGGAEDDLRVPAVRRRVFAGHVARLEDQNARLDRLTAGDAIERSLVAAARADVKAALALARFEERWAPGDPDAPFAPDVTADHLDNALEAASPEIQRLFADCELPPDVARRSDAYTV